MLTQAHSQEFVGCSVQRKAQNPQRNEPFRTTVGIDALAICPLPGLGQSQYAILPVDIYTYIAPAQSRLPVVVSIPHCGTAFPNALRAHIKPEFFSFPVDTDWLVHKLYGFAPSCGIGLVHANYARYVVDLNRDPKSAKLYDDGRPESGVIPLNSFGGQSLYQGKFALTAEHTEARLKEFYWPYYRKIEALLVELLKKHERVLFFDAHSIARFVPSIRSEPFPDLILGNQDGKTCPAEIIESAYATLSGSGFKVQKNYPFKGGYLTRYFGSWNPRVYALQLEMSQDLYLQDGKGSPKLDDGKCSKLQPVLTKMLEKMAEVLKSNG